MRAWLLSFQLWQCPLSPSPLLSPRGISEVKSQLRYSSQDVEGMVSEGYEAFAFFLSFTEHRATLDISFSFLSQETH